MSFILLIFLFSFPAPALSTVPSACIILLSYCTSATFSYISSFYISSTMSSSLSFSSILPHLLLSSSDNMQKALTLTGVWPWAVKRIEFPQEWLYEKCPDGKVMLRYSYQSYYICLQLSHSRHRQGRQGVYERDYLFTPLFISKI